MSKDLKLRRRELLTKASKLGLLGSAALGIAILDGSRRAAASHSILNYDPLEEKIFTVRRPSAVTGGRG